MNHQVNQPHYQNNRSVPYNELQVALRRNFPIACAVRPRKIEASSQHTQGDAARFVKHTVQPICWTHVQFPKAAADSYGLASSLA
jgi:hypothetical protein